jgi:hypothetical protein
MSPCHQRGKKINPYARKPKATIQDLQDVYVLKPDAAKPHHTNPYAGRPPKQDTVETPSIAEGVVELRLDEIREVPYVKLTIEEAWLQMPRQRVMTNGKKYKMIYPYLDCGCVHYQRQVMPIGEEKYYKDLVTSDVWFDHDFMRNHAILAGHKLHDRSIRVVHEYFPDEVLESKHVVILPKEVQSIVGILSADDHFCFVTINLVTKEVMIFDGLFRKIFNWGRHVIHILKRCGVIELGADKQKFRMQKFQDCIYSTRLEDGTVWTMQEGQEFVLQRDSFNCGPLASLKMMAVFGRLTPDDVNKIKENVLHLRKIVVDDFKKVLQECSGHLYVRARMQDVTALDETEGSRVERLRKDSNEKKRKRQDKQAESMQRERDKSVSKICGKVGDVVTLSCDYRQATQSHGLLGIVAAAAKGKSGGCIVVTEAGVIAKRSGQKGDAVYVPIESYEVQPTQVPLSRELKIIRKSIQQGTFDLAKVPRVSMTDVHHKLYGRSTAARGKCGCKTVCDTRCGCVRKALKCSSTCLCYGKGTCTNC